MSTKCYPGQIRINPLPADNNYSGRVIDGPLEGRWVESCDLMFQTLYYPPNPVMPWGKMPSVGATLHYIYYMWLPSYRAWVWIQRDTRQ